MQESLEASLVRIRTTDGRVVGAGFLVGEHHLLTCAHVVSQALGLPDHPLDPPQRLVSLDFPLIPPRILLTAGVVQWYPPQPDGRGDIAGLELESDPPAGAEVVHFAPVEDVWEHPFRAFGFPAGYDDGVWATGRLLGRQATDWVMIEDVKTQGFAVVPGFSGTPVWDTQAQGVVGMVVAASRPTETKTAFVIPLDVLAAAWPLITIPQGEPRNPYKGLHPFTQKDARDFFGREPVVEKLVEIVRSLVTEQLAKVGSQLLTILGPSGSGKSSLVMAGLLPQLQRGVLPGSETWLYLDPMVPGKHPIETLVLTLAAQLPDRSFASIREDLEDEAARGLHQLCTHLLNISRREQPGARVVLLVDQFEELFTQTESEDERQRFIKLLLMACSEPRGSLLALLTLRADFYDRPMQYPDLFHLIDTQHLSLLAIEPDNLRRVVEQPAALSDVQVTFEGDLVNRLLSDIQGQVGALPLLQFTLDQLFQRRSGRQLTLLAYGEIGGVKGALARHAEETYTALPSEEHRRLARALFVRLIDPGATEQDTTRRRAPLAEFTLSDTTQTRLLRETIDTFIVARLLTANTVTGTTTIEVSHEALIREWKRLADWMHEAREDIPLQQTISKDVTQWEQRGKAKDRLYRGSQLKEAQAWARRNLPSSNEVAFLRAGAARRVRYVASVTVIVLLLLSTTGVAGWFLSRPDPTHVTTSNDDGPGSLRRAIALASPKSIITFDPHLHGTIWLTSRDLVIGKPLQIRGPGANVLAISSGSHDYKVEISLGAVVSISGLTFNKSKKLSSSFIYNEGSLTLTDSVISDNEGGIFNDGGTLTLAHTAVLDNTASSDGGGIYNDNGMVKLIDSTITGNVAASNSQGGGIANIGGTVSLVNSTVARNSSTGNGGGIFNFGTLTLTNSTISGNMTIGNGGGIANYSLKNVAISSTVTLINSTVSSNTTIGNGGGIANYSYNSALASSMLTLTNSTVSENTASGSGSRGGGIFNVGSWTNIIFCTIYDNIATQGGGVFIAKSSTNKSIPNQVQMRNSIVAGNHAQSSQDIVGPLTSYGYNLIQDASGATFAQNGQHNSDIVVDTHANLKINPALTGRPPQTHALLPGSPAIDKIPLNACHVNGVSTDQRGVRRPQGAACDIGAYEYIATP